MAESQIHQHYSCSLSSTVPLQLCTTDANMSEKKDQVLKTYMYTA